MFQESTGAAEGMHCGQTLMQVGFSMMILEKYHTYIYIYIYISISIVHVWYAICVWLPAPNPSMYLIFYFSRLVVENLWLSGQKQEASRQASHSHFQKRLPTRDRHCRRRCPVRGAAKTVGAEEGGRVGDAWAGVLLKRSSVSHTHTINMKIQ